MNDGYFGYRILLLAAIIAVNAFFASAEAALIAARPSRLRELAERGQLGAQAALSLLARPARLLSTVQVGVTLASLGAGWAGEDTLYRLLVAALGPVQPAWLAALLHTAAFACAFLVLTFAMVVAGEVVPKNLAIEKSDRLAALVAPPLLVIARAFQPFVYVLERAAGVLTRMLGLRGQTSGHSVEELKMIAGSVREAGGLSRFQEQIVSGALELHEIAVREIMIPRHDMVSLSVDASLDQILRTAAEHPFSRFPVWEGQPEQIIGFLHYKDLLAEIDRQRRYGAPFRLRALLRKPLVAPESKPVDQMIEEFLHSRRHLALVVNEFGTIVGMATLEDALEEMLGAIEDEHDAREPERVTPPTVLELDGGISIRDLASQYGIELPTNSGFETLAGFLLFRLGCIPQGGETLEYEGRRYTVVEMDRRRIARVRIEPVEPASAETNTG